MERTCVNCGIIFEGRVDAKYCSSKCRVEASRKGTIEDISNNVIVLEPDEKIAREEFKFKCPNTRTKSGYWENDDETIQVRKAKYWYDVPFCAVPIKDKEDPKMPDYMNGRQYFLWRENDFQVNGDTPVIVNPLPHYDSVSIKIGGEGSYMWANK